MDLSENIAREEDMRGDQRTSTKARGQVIDFDLEPKSAPLPAPISAQQLQRPVTPTDILQLAYASGDKDIERLERLMAMEIRWREMQEEERKQQRLFAFRAAFVGLSGEGIVVPKTKHVDRGRAGSFEQAEFDECKRRLSGPCAKHGFGFSFDQKFGAKRMVVDGTEQDVAWVWAWCHLDHQQGHRETVELEGPPGDLPANTIVQNQQATATYLKRVALLAITGTATGGEDDEAKLVKQQKGEEKTERLDVLRDNGRAASLDGMKALTAWWGTLNERDRADLSKDFGAMRKAARVADEESRHV